MSNFLAYSFPCVSFTAPEAFLICISIIPLAHESMVFAGLSKL